MLKIGKRDAAGLSAGHANKSQASDAAIFGAIRDEMTSRNTATIATANSAVTAVADATDLAEVLTLANDLKAKYNAAVTLINEFKTALNVASAKAELFEK